MSGARVGKTQGAADGVAKEYHGAIGHTGIDCDFSVSRGLHLESTFMSSVHRPDETGGVRPGDVGRRRKALMVGFLGSGFEVVQRLLQLIRHDERR